jgi:hypothetical protein
MAIISTDVTVADGRGSLCDGTLRTAADETVALPC